MFIPIERWASILKIVGKEVFLIKPKHQNHLPQWGEWVYRAQPWKECRILCASMFILIERWTSILKMVKREVFLMKPKHKYHLSQWGKCVYGA